MNVINLLDQLNNLSVDQAKMFLETLPITLLKSLKEHLDDMYYNSGVSGISDVKYDILTEILVVKDPDYIISIGAKLKDNDNKVVLPVNLGSMDKYKPGEDTEIMKWEHNNPADDYVVSEKLDGVSCLIQYKDGKINLYTRGNGVVGSDISYLRKYLKHIPILDKNLMVRGELIISKKDFAINYSKKYANARNLVSGVVNSKTLKPASQHVQFIAYEVIGDGKMQKPTEQFNQLTQDGFKVVKYRLTNDLNVENLVDLLTSMRESSEFEIDGIIVQSDISYYRNESGNPKYAFAFKMITDAKDAEVLEVIWSVSKSGMLKPRIRIEPIELSQVTITYATAFNAKYVVDNNIGPGAVVLITRSGDVIPYILEVIKGAVEPEMPDVPFKWNDTNVDIIAEEGGSAMCVKIIVHFFTTLGIKHVSDATVIKMYDNGLNSLMKIIQASKEDLLKVPTFKEKSVIRIYDSIHNGLQNVDMENLMAATSIFGFGFGRRRAKMLLKAIPDLIINYKSKTIDDILAVEGFSYKTAEKVINGLGWFNQFLKITSSYITVKEKVIINQSLKGMKFVFSGFRDKVMEAAIELRGGSISTSVSKNTSGVIVSNKDQVTSKTTKAFNLNIPIYTKEDFNSKYII